MTKVKLFSDVTYFGSSNNQNGLERLEDNINSWLKEHSLVKIMDIKLSSYTNTDGDSDGFSSSDNLTVMVIYETEG